MPWEEPHHEVSDSEKAFYSLPWPFIPLPGHFSVPESPSDALLGSCLPGVCWQEVAGGTEEGVSLQSLLSRQDFPASSLLVPAAAPLNKAPCNPSEVLLPIHAPQELCLSTKSLKPSPDHLISISSTSLSSVTFLFTTVSAGFPITPSHPYLQSASAAALAPCSHSRRDSQGKPQQGPGRDEEQQRSSCSPESPAAFTQVPH